MVHSCVNLCSRLSPKSGFGHTGRRAIFPTILWSLHSVKPTARYSVDSLSAPAWSESSHSLSSLCILDWLVIMVPRKPMHQILTEFEMWHFIRKGFQSFYISGTTPFGCLCLPYHLCSAEEAAGHGYSLILFVDMGFT